MSYDGRIEKGQHLSPETEFQPGQHWRKPKVFWKRGWLYREYITKRRSAADIAEQCGCIKNNILYWLAKHGIQRRSTAEVRAFKHWGLSGPLNPMFGKHKKKGG